MTEPQAGIGEAAGLATLVPARILLVDDHPLIREAVRERLEEEPDLSVCGEAADEAAAMALVRRLHPHVVLLDLSLGDASGLGLIPLMLNADPALRVLVLSMHDEMLYALRSLQAGARGYVNKRETPDVLVAAIRTILAGGVHINPALAGSIPQRQAGGREPAVPGTP